MSKKSVTITAAWIVGPLALVAGFVTGCFGLPRLSGTSTEVETGDNNKGPLMVMGSSRDVTINYNIPDTETKEAIRALETKLKGTPDDENVNFSRNEIRLLAHALKDLDQRTSGIEKLPDGRTQVGNDLVIGFPSIAVDEHNAAAALLQKGAYAGAFKSVAAQNNAERTHLLALTLHVLQQNDEATALVSAGLAQQPDDAKLLGLKKVLDSLTPQKEILP